MAFDPTKPVQERGGASARIIETNARGEKPIIALVTGRDGGEFLRRVYPNGRIWREQESALDLVNVPQKRSGWMNVYVSLEGITMADSVIHGRKKDADRAAGSARIACFHIEFEEGEGL